MARPVPKKSVKKSVKKSSARKDSVKKGPVKNSSVKKNPINKKVARKSNKESSVNKVEMAFRSAQKEVKLQQKNLRAARDALRSRRKEAAKRGTRASIRFVEQAYKVVAKNVVSMDKSSRSASLAKARYKVQKIMQQAESAELRAEEKVLAFEKMLAGQAEEQLKTALDKFEARWRKKRTLTDARKLRVAKKSASTRARTAVKKAQVEVRAVERKTAKRAAKPIVSPGRPGRPKKQTVATTTVKKTVPKKRGRPPGAKSGKASAGLVKKRGRPAKVKTRSVARKAATAKKAGRPSKLASAAKVTKRKGRSPKK